MQPQVNTEILPIFQGEKHTIYLPSGRVVIVRETNGDDDDTLSRLADSDGNSVFNFLANIVMHDQYLNKKPLVEDIMGWHASDKYYLLYKQRLINRGSKLEFQHECQNDKCPTNQPSFLDSKAITYEQDLNMYDGNLADADYKPKNSQPVKYPKGKDLEYEFTISSKKRFKVSILTGLLEKIQLEQPVGSLSKNSILTARNLSVWDKSQWVPVKFFGAFSSRELSEVRGLVRDNDPLFDPMVSFNCQYCKQPYNVPLLAIPVFFWPEDMV
jgi:hypothetical protein